MSDCAVKSINNGDDYILSVSISLMNWPIGNVSHVRVPNKRNQIGVIYSKLERYKVEINQLSCRPELVESHQ